MQPHPGQNHQTCTSHFTPSHTCLARVRLPWLSCIAMISQQYRRRHLGLMVSEKGLFCLSVWRFSHKLKVVHTTVRSEKCERQTRKKIDQNHPQHHEFWSGCWLCGIHPVHKCVGISGAILQQSYLGINMIVFAQTTFADLVWFDVGICVETNLTQK